MNTYSKKYYNKETGKWEPLYATEGMSAYETAKLNGFTGTEEEFNTALSEMPSIIGTVYHQHSLASITSDVKIFETGVQTSVTLTAKVLFDGKDTTPSSLILKKGDQIISESVDLDTIDDSISETTKYQLDAEVYKGVIKHGEVTIFSYYPQYFGSSSKEAITAEDVLTLVKQPIKSSPAGNVTIEVGEGEYLWLCVPSTMEINKVTSSGIDVPMNSKITLDVEGKTSYDCYRSASTFKAGTFNGVIS